MVDYWKSIALALLILAVAAAAAGGLIPERIADIAPFALLAMFPGAWLGRNGRCRRKGSAA